MIYGVRKENGGKVEVEALCMCMIEYALLYR